MDWSMSTLALGAYSVFLLNQIVDREIQWCRKSFFAYVFILITKQLAEPFLSQWICVSGMLVLMRLHWNNIPQTTLPANQKSVLITGCDRGIGNALAKLLDNQGYKVFAGCLDASSEEAQSLANSSSDRLIIVQMDVRNLQQIEDAFHTVQKHLQHNKLWALVNNAGICYIGNIEIMSTEDIQTVMNVNFLGALNVSRTFLPLLRRGKGRLVNVSSNAGLAPVAHMGVYCASKSALAILSESMRYELQKWGMHVSTVVPSGYRTGILAYNKQVTAERWWKSASPIVKQDFGKHCFIPEFKVANHESNTNPDLSSIVQTITTAISVKTPRSFYYSGFLSQALPYAYTFLPPFIREPVMKLIADWFVFEPSALKVKHRQNGLNNNKIE